MTSSVFVNTDLRITGEGLTHRGCVRERNEDAILVDPEGEVWAIADGMGGYGQGDVAASMVVDALALVETDGDPQDTLVRQLEKTNSEIHRRADGATMGATVVALLIKASVATLAWVGDSRIYLWRSDKLAQLSRDHSQVQEWVDAGVLTSQMARSHPERHVVTRALGAETTVAVDTAILPLGLGDRILLCSDGLTGCVSDTEIALILALGRPDRATAARLIQAAIDAGAPDNVSVIVITAGQG